MNSFDEVFEQTKLYITKQGLINDIALRTWIDPLVPVKLDGQNAVFDVETEFQQGIINSTYKDKLEKALEEVMGFPTRLVVNVNPRVVEAEPAGSGHVPDPGELDEKHAELKRSYEFAEYDYTFDTFIVGRSNEFAYAACKAVATDQGSQSYNPLFIYGPSGLGKTHLVTAIRLEINRRSPDKNVIYVTGESFGNELIKAIGQRDTSLFHDKYRNADVLIVDDIQFFSGKEQMQEEFFHTFNKLHSEGKQIVITSDKPPKEMETLTERLRTRFEMGLPVDIQIPTYETKMAILNKKCDMKGLDIPADVKDFIATHIKSNIRELEGSLTKLSFYSNLTHEKITLPVAQEALKDLISPESSREITPDLIVKIVADHFNLTPDAILSQSRNAELNYARQIVMYLCRQMTTATQKQIGDLLGRDHSTIKHGADKIAKDILTDSSTRDTVNVLIKKIDPS